MSKCSGDHNLPCGERKPNIHVMADLSHLTGPAERCIGINLDPKYMWTLLCVLTYQVINHGYDVSKVVYREQNLRIGHMYVFQ